MGYVANCNIRSASLVEEDGVPVAVDYTVLKPGDAVEGLSDEVLEDYVSRGLVLEVEDKPKAAAPKAPAKKVAGSSTTSKKADD